MTAENGSARAQYDLALIFELGVDLSKI